MSDPEFLKEPEGRSIIFKEHLEPVSEWTIDNWNIIFRVQKKIPNKFIRFFQRYILGIEWRKFTKKPNNYK